MQLNRNSGIVRWYLFATFAHSEEAKRKALAEATNLCVFVEWLVIGTITRVLGGVLFLVAVPCGWMTTAFVLVGAAMIGFIPVGWHSSFRDDDPLAYVVFPAFTFQWERKLGIRIGTRMIFPNHVWGTALVALSVWALAHWEASGWSRAEISVGWYVAHGTALAAVLLTVAIAAYAKWRNTEVWRVACAWLRAKKDRVCPRIEFVD